MPIAPLPDCDWLPRLRALIQRRVGLVIRAHQDQALAESVADICGSFRFDSPLAFVQALDAAPDNSPLFEQLVSRITIGESYFFRDAAQMRFLEQEFLPGLIRQRRATNRTLRVWSAATSDGQELYSIAILLHELLSDDLAGWNLSLLGTDINLQALSRADAGCYSDWSLRGLSEVRYRRHFVEEATADGHCRIRQPLRDMVRFSYLNLASDAFPSLMGNLHSMDVILCRNVFIYFDAPRVRDILRRLVATLAPGGVLLLGASDIIDLHVDGLETVTRAGMSFYRKAPAAAEAAWAPASFTPAAPASAPALRASPPAPAGAPAQASAAFETCLATARDLGNQGRTEAALHWCEQGLALRPTDADTHFLHALLLQEAGRVDDAFEAFRRTLFLQADFALAHYQFALLQLGSGRRERGLRSLRNARDLLARAPADQPLRGAEHIPCGHMKQIIENELLIHAPGRPS